MQIQRFKPNRKHFLKPHGTWSSVLLNTWVLANLLTSHKISKEKNSHLPVTKCIVSYFLSKIVAAKIFISLLHHLNCTQTQSCSSHRVRNSGKLKYHTVSRDTEPDTNKEAKPCWQYQRWVQTTAAEAAAQHHKEYLPAKSGIIS